MAPVVTVSGGTSAIIHTFRRNGDGIDAANNEQPQTARAATLFLPAAFLLSTQVSWQSVLLLGGREVRQGHVA